MAWYIFARNPHFCLSPNARPLADYGSVVHRTSGKARAEKLIEWYAEESNLEDPPTFETSELVAVRASNLDERALVRIAGEVERLQSIADYLHSEEYCSWNPVFRALAECRLQLEELEGQIEEAQRMRQRDVPGSTIKTPGGGDGEDAAQVEPERGMRFGRCIEASEDQESALTIGPDGQYGNRQEALRALCEEALTQLDACRMPTGSGRAIESVEIPDPVRETIATLTALLDAIGQPKRAGVVRDKLAVADSAAEEHLLAQVACFEEATPKSAIWEGRTSAEVKQALADLRASLRTLLVLPEQLGPASSSAVGALPKRYHQECTEDPEVSTAARAFGELTERQKQILLAHQKSEEAGQKPPTDRALAKCLRVSAQTICNERKHIEAATGAPLPGRDKDRARRESAVPPADLDSRPSRQ